MRAYILAAAVAAASAAPAFGRGLESVETLGPLPGAIGAITVTVSPDIIEAPRGTIRSDLDLDTIGPRDAEDVARIVQTAFEGSLERAGLFTAGAPGAGRLEITVTKAKASNLQFTDYGRFHNLRSGSIAVGGAAFDARLLAADGAAAATYEYSYFETFLDPNFPPVSPWEDLRRSARRFASEVADHVGEEGLTN